MIAEVRSGSEATLDWACETWGAVLSAEKAVVYSLYVESFAETVPLSIFERVIRSWRAFIVQPPVEGDTITVTF